MPDEAIVDDYARSESAYKELGDQDAMVGALAQVNYKKQVLLRVNGGGWRGSIGSMVYL